MIQRKARDYLYEPDPKALLDTPASLCGVSGLSGRGENSASEQAARMAAMKAATDTAGSPIKEPQLVYNSSSGQHYQELTEIVSGPPRFNHSYFVE